LVVTALALALAARGVRAADPPAPASHKVLRILVVPDPQRPDFFSVDASGPPGFERELLEGFARARHLQIEIVPVKGWDEVVAAVVDGKGDVIAGHCTDTPERRRYVDFTDGVLPTRTVVITRRPHAPILRMQDLATQRIGAVKGSASHHELLAAGVPRSRIDESLTQENLLELLRAKKLDAVVRAAPLAILSQRDDPELELGMFLGPPSSFSWGVSKKDLELKAALNEHLAVVRRAGVWSRLVVKYFGDASLTLLKNAQEQ
jgi:membrane-bound lytic murein transglycosylase F